MKILKKLLEKLLELIFRLAAVTIVTIPAASALIDAAYAERGYSAIGGEWLLIIVIAGSLWAVSGLIIKRLTTDPDQQKGSGKS